jgi:hypothetical protein
MSRLDELPPDQQAALSLLVKQGRSYAQVAAMLSISEQAVHDRAHAALAMLAPALARTLTAEQRKAIGDYLLGQDDQGSSAETGALALLGSSAPARGWASAVRSELAPLGATLPEIPTPAQQPPDAGATPPAVPAEPAAVAPATGAAQPPAPMEPAAAAAATRAAQPAAPVEPVAAASATGAAQPAAPAKPAAASATGAAQPQPAPPAPGAPPPEAAEPAASEPAGTGHDADGAGSRRGSRIGGAVVLALIVAAAVAAVLLITGGSGKSSRHTGTTAATGSKVKVTARIIMRPPNPASHAIGAVDVLAEGSRHAFFIAAEKLPATNGFYYAIWLYNSPTSHRPLNRAPAVGSNHSLQGGSLLPSDAGNYSKILLTRETSTSPTQPGPTVLEGNFTLGH